MRVKQRVCSERQNVAYVAWVARLVRADGLDYCCPAHVRLPPE